GYEAMVTGSQSFAHAFKHAVGDSLLATGKEMQINALKEVALGFAALAFGPMGGPSASAHFAAAAMFEGGAVAAGLAASELGAGGHVGGAGSHAGSHGGAGSVPPVSGGGYGAGGSHVVYVIGDPWGDQTSRQRANNFKRQARAAIGDAMGRSS